MNSRELAVISTAVVFGAFASSLAFRLFFSGRGKEHPTKDDLSANGVVSSRSSSQNEFDPSKRKGFVVESPI